MFGFQGPGQGIGADHGCNPRMAAAASAGGAFAFLALLADEAPLALGVLVGTHPLRTRVVPSSVRLLRNDHFPVSDSGAQNGFPNPYNIGLPPVTGTTAPEM